MTEGLPYRYSYSQLQVSGGLWLVKDGRRHMAKCWDKADAVEIVRALNASPADEPKGDDLTADELMSKTPGQVAAYFIPDVIHDTAGCTSRVFHRTQPHRQQVLADVLRQLLKRADEPKGDVRKALEWRKVADALDWIIESHPDKVEQFRAKPALIGWFVGQTIRAMNGEADPEFVAYIAGLRLTTPSQDDGELRRALCEQIDHFNDIIDLIERRCLAADGPVTPTLQEMREDELASLWNSLQFIRNTFRAREALSRSPEQELVRQFNEWTPKS